MTYRDDIFVPVTETMGFLELPLREVSDGLVAWRRSLHKRTSARQREGGLDANIQLLAPLTVGSTPRELLVATAGGRWTAVLDCSATGGTQDTTVGHLSQILGCSGVVVTDVPHRPATPTKPVRFGARRFHLFGPLTTDWLNSVREIAAVHDEDGWAFAAVGTPQVFEEMDAYTQRRVTDRFTFEMLVRYCQALGIQPFDPAFFCGPSVVVQSKIKTPRGLPTFTFAEAQERWSLR